MDLDSPNFDPKRYVLTMLKQNTIKQLIRRNNEIDEDIKVHDQEIQSLVFENYSKFISSIDTVRQMKDNICMVDEKLKVLDNSMEKISELALKIDQTFKFKRKEIQKLDTVNKDLQKLRNLCDFPNTLKQDLNEYKSVPQNKMSQSFAQGQKLFSKSIVAYEECFQTLQDLKSQPLIEPIYKESLTKIDEVRSILRTRQVQFNKEYIHSKALRSITKSLIIISDEQGQISILRSYFHSWRDRLIFKRKVLKAENSKKYDHQLTFNDLLTQFQVPESNEEFWDEFLNEFSFVHQQLYGKLILSDQINLLVNSYSKQLFNWVISNELDDIPAYCNSIKSYIHLHHVFSQNLQKALNKMKSEEKNQIQKQYSRDKLYEELSLKLSEKISNIGSSMINFVFGRLKLTFIEQLSDSKEKSKSMNASEDLMKESYIKILAPIKETFKNNFQLVLNDLEHLNVSHGSISEDKSQYQTIIHQQIESLIKFLGLAISQNPMTISQEFYAYINQNTKMHKLQKAYIDSILKEYCETEEGGCWFAVSNNYLNYLCNQLGKKIIDSTYKRLEISQTYNYANTFTFCKECLSKNLLNLIRFFTIKIEQQTNTQDIFKMIRQFIETINLVFPDSRRNILKKPSFLIDGSSYTHETQIMTAKKLRVIEKALVPDRNNVITVFVRKILKHFLMRIRTNKIPFSLEINDAYCLIQICYEMGNVEEESQISAFYHLLAQGIKKSEEDVKREELEQFYSEIRSRYVEINS